MSALDDIDLCGPRVDRPGFGPSHDHCLQELPGFGPDQGPCARDRPGSIIADGHCPVSVDDHGIDQPPSATCELCGSSFTRRNHLNRHVADDRCMRLLTRFAEEEELDVLELSK
ncbi:hypothetical protein LSAT2_021003 [Lamellibrachia satsuma]|nr:hypothetical protein LSAT2_021003 [Lamellibrachia satsuma]